MELLEEYRGKLASVVEKYYFESNQTEKYWDRDNLAALKIQSKFKMYMRRKEFLRMKAGKCSLTQPPSALRLPSGRTTPARSLPSAANKNSTADACSFSRIRPPSSRRCTEGNNSVTGGITHASTATTSTNSRSICSDSRKRTRNLRKSLTNMQLSRKLKSSSARRSSPGLNSPSWLETSTTSPRRRPSQESTTLHTLLANHQHLTSQWSPTSRTSSTSLTDGGLRQRRTFSNTHKNDVHIHLDHGNNFQS